MRSLIYDVAMSIDGFIAGAGGDASALPFEGPHVEAYLTRLATYGTVLMGRRTYEFGYAFGLKPGARAYPHMDHHIVSTSLLLPPDAEVALVTGELRAEVLRLKTAEGGPIYLCGGGQLAGALARLGLIDILRLKIAPLVLGNGIKLFEALDQPLRLREIAREAYANGVTYAEFAVENR